MPTIMLWYNGSWKISGLVINTHHEKAKSVYVWGANTYTSWWPALRTTSYKLQVLSYKLQVTSYKLQVTTSCSLCRVLARYLQCVVGFRFRPFSRRRDNGFAHVHQFLRKRLWPFQRCWGNWPMWHNLKWFATCAHSGIPYLAWGSMPLRIFEKVRLGGLFSSLSMLFCSGPPIIFAMVTQLSNGNDRW